MGMTDYDTAMYYSAITGDIANQHSYIDEVFQEMS
jgi:hypothetical protein